MEVSIETTMLQLLPTLVSFLAQILSTSSQKLQNHNV